MTRTELGILPCSHRVQRLFQDTLPQAEICSISVRHIDVDWYESAKTCLDRLYDRVSRGGIIQIDDYGHLEGARKAVGEFFGRRLSERQLPRLDYPDRQFVKT
jgi:O-methyltransferase